MARKSKRDDLARSNDLRSKPVVRDSGRQPRIVGWLVLIIGGASSWFWYKPLPEVVHQAVYSTHPSSWATSKSGPKSLWSEQNLILPSTDVDADSEVPASREEVSNSQRDDSRLIGAPKVTLIPWSETQHDIRDVLKTERIPMIPVAPDLNGVNMSIHGPQVWTPDQQRNQRFEESTPSISMWPDAGYVPKAKIQKNQRRSAVQITTQIPTLLETGMKSIRTSESDESNSQSSIIQSDKAASTASTEPQPTRKPQFIRQPRRND